MNPLNCPKCGRFMSKYGSTGHADAIREWEVCWGTCLIHGEQEWSTR